MNKKKTPYRIIIKYREIKYKKKTATPFKCVCELKSFIGERFFFWWNHLSHNYIYIYIWEQSWTLSKLNKSLAVKKAFSTVEMERRKAKICFLVKTSKKWEFFLSNKYFSLSSFPLNRFLFFLVVIVYYVL